METGSGKRLHMRMLAIAILVQASGLVSIVTAENWTTPDGFLTVTKPSESEFEELASPPTPIVGYWSSKDGRLSLAVVIVDIPAQVVLNQASAEEGMAEEIGEPVTRLPTRKIGGFEVWTMTAKNSEAEITQAMLRNEGKLYKLMAIKHVNEPNPEEVNAFLGSVQLVESRPSLTTNEEREVLPESRLDLHNLSKRMGGIVLLALVALLAYWATCKRTG